jgi:hypothetical protein
MFGSRSTATRRFGVPKAHMLSYFATLADGVPSPSRVRPAVADASDRGADVLSCSSTLTWLSPESDRQRSGRDRHRFPDLIRNTRLRRFDEPEATKDTLEEREVTTLRVIIDVTLYQFR